MSKSDAHLLSSGLLQLRCCFRLGLRKDGRCTSIPWVAAEGTSLGATSRFLLGQQAGVGLENLHV